MADLAGKVALVTGGSRGIGAAIAKRLAREGAAVALTYVNGKEKADAVVRDIEAAGGRALALQADSGDAEAVRGAVREAARVFGKLDILVNNAGVGHLATIAEFPLEEFDRLVAVNVRGVFAAVKEAVAHMGEGGRVITIGSMAAERVPMGAMAVYAMTKAAILGLTRGLARDLGPRGITVNNVQPGPIDTDMSPADGAYADVFRSGLAIKRFGTGDEVAAMVAYLASPEAGFVTGASLTIDGGNNA